MSDEIKHGHEEAEFEQEDLGARPILMFLGGLALVMLLLHFGLRGAYSLMNRYNAEHQPEVSPLKPVVKTDTQSEMKDTVTHFPQPQLEENERQELKDVRLGEERTLHSYGWVDEKGGVVRIPIERAMELTAERGLPVRPATGKAPASVVNTAKEAGQKSGGGPPKKRP